MLAAAEEELHLEQSSEVAQELPQDEFERRACRILSMMDDMGISKQSKETVADSGYGSEQNYEYMIDNDMVPNHF